MSVQASALSPTADRAALKALAEFSSDTAEILNAKVPLVARLTLTALGAMVALSFVMAAVLPIDRVVATRGHVSSDAARMVVQPLETSIIRSVLVREGQVVKKGDLLATLDPTFSTADVAVATRFVASLSAEIARLEAEMNGTSYVPSDSDIYGDLQSRIYQSRQAQYATTTATYDEKTASTEAGRNQAVNELKFYQERLTLVSEAEAMKKSLMEQGVISRSEFLEISDERLDIERAIATVQGRIDTAAHELDALGSQKASFVEQWRSETMTALVDQQEQLDNAREQLAKAGKRSELVEMRAIEDAVVLQVADMSVGSIVQSAEKLFILVPAGAGLEVEAEISPTDQGFVKVGQEVELKLDAWPYSKHGTAHGVVKSISADTLAVGDQASARAIYLAKIEITSSALNAVPEDFHLVPGMPLTADVVVGDQTLAAYLLSRAIPAMTEGFREP